MTSATPPTIEDVIRQQVLIGHLLERHHFRFDDEIELQDGIEKVLANAGWEAAREHVLTPRDRPDFFIASHGVAIEVKIKGAPHEIERQLIRYAEHERVHGVMLVTQRRQIALGFRGVHALHRKPLRVVSVAGGLL